MFKILKVFLINPNGLYSVTLSDCCSRDNTWKGCLSLAKQICNIYNTETYSKSVLGLSERQMFG